VSYVGDGSSEDVLSGTVDALLDPQSYRNALYLLLSFPLGLVYFVVLTVGFSLGVGLAVIVIGLPIILAVLVGARVLAEFERTLANALLGTEIRQPATLPEWNDLRGFVEGLLRSRATWMGLAFLFVKLWIGIAGFTLVVTGAALGGALLTAPLTYTAGAIQLGPWVVDTLPEAVLVMPLGIVVVLVAVNLVNALAHATGTVATALLDTPEAYDTVPSADGPS